MQQTRADCCGVRRGITIFRTASTIFGGNFYFVASYGVNFASKKREQLRDPAKETLTNRDVEPAGNVNEALDRLKIAHLAPTADTWQSALRRAMVGTQNASVIPYAPSLNFLIIGAACAITNFPASSATATFLLCCTDLVVQSWAQRPLNKHFGTDYDRSGRRSITWVRFADVFSKLQKRWRCQRDSGAVFESPCRYFLSPLADTQPRMEGEALRADVIL